MIEDARYSRIDSPFSLAGKRILITGATSGLGHATAITCARLGATVVGVGRDPARLEDTQQALARLSDAPHQLIRTDLTEETEREGLLDALKDPLDGILHSAGISRIRPFRMITADHLRELQAINVEAPMLLTQGMLRKRLIASGGSVLFMASIAAHIGVAGVAAYSGTKAALIAMMRCLAMEVVKHGIRVNCLAPALVETPLFEATKNFVGSVDDLRSSYPLGFGQPEDVANAAVFFLSPASRWITGTTLVLDGGLTIS